MRGFPLVFGSVCLDVKAGEEGAGAAKKWAVTSEMFLFFLPFFLKKIKNKKSDPFLFKAH